MDVGCGTTFCWLALHTRFLRLKRRLHVLYIAASSKWCSLNLNKCCTPYRPLGRSRMIQDGIYIYDYNIYHIVWDA